MLVNIIQQKHMHSHFGSVVVGGSIHRRIEIRLREGKLIFEHGKQTSSAQKSSHSPMLGHRTLSITLMQRISERFLVRDNMEKNM